MKRRVWRSVIATSAMLAILAGMAGSAVAADKWVTMYANEYRPGVVTINAGDTVTWVNDDDVDHDAVGRGWRTSVLGYYESDAVTFRRAGTYPYRCSIHPQMRSSVIVRGAGGGGGAGATVPPTDVIVRLPETAETGQPSWVAPASLVAGAAILIALLWRPRRGRSTD